MTFVFQFLASMDMDKVKVTVKPAEPVGYRNAFKWNSLMVRGGMIWGGFLVASYVIAYAITPEFNKPLYMVMTDSMEKQRRTLYAQKKAEESEGNQ